MKDERAARDKDCARVYQDYKTSQLPVQLWRSGRLTGEACMKMVFEYIFKEGFDESCDD